MNSWLYLTADGLATASNDWPCCVWSSTGQRQLITLDQAEKMLSGQTIDLLLPMEMCSWVRSDPWPSRRQPSLQAIAFAVEDQLGDTLENLHLSVGARDRDGRYPVMVIERQRFAGLLERLAEVGIEVRSVVVDADMLPGAEPLVVRWFGRWLVGGAMPARVALQDDGLTALRRVLPADTRWIDERHEAVDVEQCLRHSQAINLLQGAFAPRGKHLPWRHAGLALLTLLLLTWGASAARLQFLESETGRLYSQNEQRFKTLYPDQTRIVDLATQLNALHSRTAEPETTRIAGLVSLIEQVIGASHVEVRRIEFRAGDGWRIQLTANSFAELEQLRERGRQQGVPVRLDSSSREQNRVQATLTVEHNL
ncbi:type II secretion system protein GspL [Pseudomonas sp. 14P_8.1_Bac3]|uniref:type II secretion system protein GspL n=1 Tax=Pseudomonas sp. 14P_8.1_Bac3 TaxID=2971621 RepID=UPI0021C7039D|nr:type II secretion system protein GspL [Pseudomonas sp. 14P_8.1_Bac3]MCU1759043.1 type II secretion system protein GspL [Pseudomonas sp. 14P_8.1_Bac3]